MQDMRGTFAISRAGHDIGQIYIITQESEEYVYLADGKTRTVERPKRKNKKHVQVVRKGVNEEIRNKLLNNQLIYNEEIKRVIKLQEVKYVEI